MRKKPLSIKLIIIAAFITIPFFFSNKSRYEKRDIHGITVLVDTHIDTSDKIFDHVEEQIGIIKKATPKKNFKLLNGVKITVLATSINIGGHYTPSTTNNKSYGIQGNIKIYNGHIIQYSKEKGNPIVIHELAHAYHDKLPKNWKEFIKKTYESAISQGLYKSVEGKSDRKIKKTYALKNEYEYFAELSAKYFAGNYYFPFNKEELQDYDIKGYEMVNHAWTK